MSGFRPGHESDVEAQASPSRWSASTVEDVTEVVAPIRLNQKRRCCFEQIAEFGTQEGLLYQRRGWVCCQAISNTLMNVTSSAIRSRQPLGSPAGSATAFGRECPARFGSDAVANVPAVVLLGPITSVSGSVRGFLKSHSQGRGVSRHKPR
jgi:hypothetical protein